MQRRDAFDVGCSALAGVGDALAFFLGFLLAVWIRFESGWIPDWLARHFIDPPPNRDYYLFGALVGSLILFLVFRSLRLYERPQFGVFSEYVPRITRAVGLGLLLCAALAFAIRTPNPPFSRVVVGLSLGTVWLCVLIERALLFRAELAWARRQTARLPVVIIGADDTCARLGRALERDPRQRAVIRAWIAAHGAPAAEAIPPALLLPDRAALTALLDRGEARLVIAGPGALSEDEMVGVMLACHRRLVEFRMIPGLFSVRAGEVSIETVDGIPVLGFGRWPLDFFWNRFWKRAEDLAGALAGLLISAPVLAAAAVCIRRESAGPILYRQERCGRDGRPFTLYKLRTMRADAEAESGPVWTAPDDPRRTRTGAVLRAWNIDELPQLWNVLRGEMSLVGPRPERPHFVAQFRDDMDRYMMRHVSKPGLTGWAQVNGLRGRTDLRERLKYDLWYLEHWSLSLDFKILARTFFARKNAY
jgi:exopolysaccharide biosynthesis polyprenyl glycosylphosphotransferase